VITPCITFASVARQVAERGWRPFPGLQQSKVPAMQQWSALCSLEWDTDDLTATINDYRPFDDYCCCLAAQREIVALDADILNPEHAAFAAKLADNVLGVTPLIRIGLAPKCIRVYRAGDLIRSTKLHSLEVFSGSGQFIGFGWHLLSNS
jgi:putative DNA primase/helicase